VGAGLFSAVIASTILPIIFIRKAYYLGDGESYNIKSILMALLGISSLRKGKLRRDEQKYLGS
jgi:hypothetical protein